MANISNVELNGTTYNIIASGSIPTSEKGVANGVATLDSTGKVPSSQLPSSGGGSVNSVKVGSTSYNPDSSGVVSLPAYPTTLPANGGTASNVSGTVAITNGGTGATSASLARSNLGLGSAATKSSTTSVTSGSSALVTSGGVYSALAAIDSNISYVADLEEDDRAVLAGIVDSGAKNLYTAPSKTWTQSYATVSWDESTNIATLNITATTGTLYFGIGSWVAPETGTYYLYADGATSANMLVYDDANWATYNIPGQSKSPIATWTKGTSRMIYIRLSGAAAVTNKQIKIMICKKAAFDVSSKFVPYRVPITGVFCRHEQVACTTTLSSTGIKCVIPEDGIYRVLATAIYSNAKPLQLVIKKHRTTDATWLVENETTDSMSLTVFGVANASATEYFEVFVKYSSATTNRILVVVEKVG